MIAKGRQVKFYVLFLAGGIAVVLGVLSPMPGRQSVNPKSSFAPEIPKTWDDQAMATLEVPLANPIGSPKHVSADYYYRIPVRPIYKSYPVYAPGHEPPGYMEWLKQQEPVVVWDDKGHTPPLKTEAEWIRAGELVFDSPLTFTPATSPAGSKRVLPDRREARRL